MGGSTSGLSDSNYSDWKTYNNLSKRFDLLSKLYFTNIYLIQLLLIISYSKLVATAGAFFEK